MKFLSININHPEKCVANLKNEFKCLSDSERKNRIINLIRNKNPDVIFFIEQWYPVFSLIEEHLNSKEQNSYVFCYPQGFNPSFFKDGTYPSYAGVVAAFKNSIFSSVSCKDGTLWIKEKSAKWLSLEIDGKKYLGVHYPQPGPEWNGFHTAVKSFAKTNNPFVIMGDFNTPKNCSIKIDGYKDVLGPEPTSAFNTKLDYIFVPSELFCKANAEIITDVMNQGNHNFFSDHSATIVSFINLSF